MTPQFYTPSGRYPQSALKVFGIVVFLSTALSGLLYGWFISEFGFSAYANVNYILLILTATIALSGAIAWLIIKKLKIHSPITLKVFGIAVFSSMVFVGTLCGWLMLKHGFSATNINYIFFALSATIIMNGAIISWATKKLKIRNPTILGRLAAVASFSGWSINWFSLYGTAYFNHKTEANIVTFIFNRLSGGIQGVWPIPGRSSKVYTVLFHVPDFVLLPLWLLETLAIPYLLARWAASEAGCPFSENTETWHNHSYFGLKIISPEKKELLPKIWQGDINALFAAQPAKYDLTGWLLHVFIYSPQGYGNFYIGIYANPLYSIFSFLGREAKTITRYWQISPEDIARLDERFTLPIALPKTNGTSFTRTANFPNRRL